MTQINFAHESAQIQKSSFWDASLLTLLLANGITIAATLYGDWQFMTIVFIYWAQSVTIGVFTAKRMKAVKRYTISQNMSMNGQPIPITEAGKNAMVSFFIMHYGIFHLVYFIFLIIYSFIRGIDWFGVIFATILFVINHYFSHKKNLEEDTKKLVGLGRMMFHPYARIIPMHLTVILGFIFSGTTGLIIFMTLKTIADLVGHLIEHANWNKLVAS